jgi:hypothetical protein
VVFSSLPDEEAVDLHDACNNGPLILASFVTHEDRVIQQVAGYLALPELPGERGSFLELESSAGSSARASFRTACSITAVWLMPSLSDRRRINRKHSSESRKLVGFLGIAFLGDGNQRAAIVWLPAIDVHIEESSEIRDEWVLPCSAINATIASEARG